MNIFFVNFQLIYPASGKYVLRHCKKYGITNFDDFFCGLCPHFQLKAKSQAASKLLIENVEVKSVEFTQFIC